MIESLMKFVSGSNVLEFEAGADYPAERVVELFEVQDRTAAGTLKVESLGVTSQRRVLNWSLMGSVDYFALIDWFINVSNGGRNNFYFTDEYGVEGLVKITSGRINFREVSLGSYAGTITLEYV